VDRPRGGRGLAHGRPVIRALAGARVCGTNGELRPAVCPTTGTGTCTVSTTFARPSPR
jgi:hypothetical protein